MSNNVNVPVYGIYKSQVLYSPPNIATVGEYRISLVQFGSEKTAQDKFTIYRNKISGVDGVLRGIVDGRLQDLIIVDDYIIFIFDTKQNILGRMVALIIEN